MVACRPGGWRLGGTTRPISVPSGRRRAPFSWAGYSLEPSPGAAAAGGQGLQGHV